MPYLPDFIEVAADMSGATSVLSGESRAALFSALAALNDLHQWVAPGGLFPADITYIYDVLNKATRELLMTQIGQMVTYVTLDPPEFTIPCDGSEFLAVDYPELFAVLDDAYKIDADTFVTPDLNSRSPIGAGSGVGLRTYTVNEQFGEEDHTLITGEIPSHQHGIFQGLGLALAPGEEPVKVPSLLAGDATDLAGGGGGHNTIHPVTAVKFALVYK